MCEPNQKKRRISHGQTAPAQRSDCVDRAKQPATPLSTTMGNAGRIARHQDASQKTAYENGIEPVAISSAASLAHELANLLDGASRYLSLTRSQWAQIDQENPSNMTPAICRQIGQQLTTADRAMTDMKQLLHHAQREKLWQLDGRMIGCDQLVEESLALIDLIVQQRRLVVTVSMDTAAADVLLPRLMKLVFINGLNNAIEAMGDQGCLAISACVVDRGLCLAIEDDGMGLSIDRTITLASDQRGAKESLEPGHTVDQKMNVARWEADRPRQGSGPLGKEPSVGTSRKGPGHGWGLSLSRQWVEAMGGVLRLTNRSTSGARWEVVVPVWRKDQ